MEVKSKNTEIMATGKTAGTITETKSKIINTKRQFRVEYTRHDSSHCLAPGLFRSLQKGERKETKLNVVYEYGGKKRIEFSGPEPLGVDDLRVLQGLVGLAGLAKSEILDTNPKTEVGKQLRTAMEMEFDAVFENAVVIQGSYWELAHEIGWAPNDTKSIRDCIERMWKVSIIAQNEKGRRGFRLLSKYSSTSDGRDGNGKVFGKLCIALNPIITKAVLGNGKHSHINFSEVRALKSDPARLLYQRLCGWINPGQIRQISINTLCEYVWPDPTENLNTLKKRRRVVRTGLNELVDLGWVIVEYDDGKWEIGRPKIIQSIRQQSQRGRREWLTGKVGVGILVSKVESVG